MKTFSRSVRNPIIEPVSFEKGHRVCYEDDTLIVVCSGVTDKYNDGMPDPEAAPTFEGTVIDSKTEGYCVGEIDEELFQSDFVNFYGIIALHSERDKQGEGEQVVEKTAKAVRVEKMKKWKVKIDEAKMRDFEIGIAKLVIEAKARDRSIDKEDVEEWMKDSLIPRIIHHLQGQ